MTRIHRSHHRIFTALVVAFVTFASARIAAAADGAYITVFRNPATGLELRRGHFGAFAGYYPTILKADGQDEGENTNFIRMGISAYRKTTGWSHYAATSFVVSLDDDWKNGVLTDVGMRAPIGGWLHARLGVGVLTAFDGEVRVNPTVGVDVFPGAW